MGPPRRVGASSSELLKATNYGDDEAENQHEPSERCPRDGRDHKERTHSFPRAISSYYADRCLVALTCAPAARGKGRSAVRACGCFISDIFRAFRAFD